MRFSHEDIKEKLSEYIKGGLIPDEVKAHLKACKECCQEVSLLRALNETSVPEPGDMFFETLPQRVRASLHEKKKSIFFRLAPAFALIALVVLAGYIYQLKTPRVDEEFSFIDPLVPVAYDLSSLVEDDLPLIDDPYEDEEVNVSDETIFTGEFAYLSSGEMEDLYEVLDIEEENGGVL